MGARDTSKDLFTTFGRLRRRPAWGQRLWRFVRVKPLGTLGALIMLLLVLTALFADSAATFDPNKMHTQATYSPPSSQFRLGTDNYGRDVYSQIIHGSRISLAVGLLLVLLGATSGALIGIASGYLGGKTDIIVQRFMGLLMAFPMLILALALVTALGRSLPNVIIAIAVVMIPRAARVTRSSALAIKEKQYVEAARAIGCTSLRTMGRHVMPNCVAPFIILAMAELGNAILVEAALSFLGLGVPPPAPSWGGMLSGGSREYVELAPWLAVFPGLAISAVVFGSNLLGDALRDVLDPRLRRG